VVLMHSLAIYDQWFDESYKLHSLPYWEARPRLDALKKGFEDAAKRDGRRARTEALDLGLTLATLRYRDLVCLAEGADAAALDARRARELSDEVGARDPRRLRAAAERCEEVRSALQLNVTEDLALEVLGFRLGQLVGAPA
jgi:hypothetical protein